MATRSVKKPGASPSDEMDTFEELRSWQLTTGAQVFLTRTGRYIYKSGAPVRSKEELIAIIGSADESSRALGKALAWWDRLGHKISKEYYDAEEKRLEELQDKALMGPAGDVSDLDAVLYQRRPANNRSSKAYTDPASWQEQGFDRRPDWWGHAASIELGPYYFRRLSPDDLPDEDTAEQTRPTTEDLAKAAENQQPATSNE